MTITAHAAISYSIAVNIWDNPLHLMAACTLGILPDLFVLVDKVENRTDLYIDSLTHKASGGWNLWGYVAEVTFWVVLIGGRIW